MDLPESFRQVDGLTGLFSPRRGAKSEQSLTIQVRLADSDISLDEFSQGIKAREMKLRSRKWGRANILKDARMIDDAVWVFHIQEIKEAYSTEMHALIDGTYVVMTAASYKNQFPLAESRMVEFLAGVSAVTSPNPSTDDFCLGNVRIRGDFEKERASFLFRNERFPEVMISIDYDPHAVDPDQSLLSRLDGPHSLLRAFDADNKVMRKGELIVASMPAQEWLSWIVLGDDDKTMNYGFAMETLRRKPSKTQPFLHVELDAKLPMAGRTPSQALTESEVIGLWDATTRSIRLRGSLQE